MLCNHCGCHVSEGAVFCPGCGAKMQQETHSHGKKEPETVIMKGLCNRVKNSFYVQNGKAILTNRRFIYLKHHVAKILAIGLLVNLTEGDIEFEIPLSDIKEIEDGRQGFSKTIKIHTKSGEEFHFYFSKRIEWKIALQNALDDHH